MVADVGMEKWAQRHGASNLETVEEQAKRPRHSFPTAVKSHLLREKNFEKGYESSKNSECKVTGRPAGTKPRKASQVT